MATKKSGIIYDYRMTNHCAENHPESPERITHIYNALEKTGLTTKCVHVDARYATNEELSKVHTKRHLDKMAFIPLLDATELENTQNMYNSVYMNSYTHECALLSAGGVIELCDNIMQGKINNGIAVVRPPGHHAESDKAMGFCIYNNVAVAAQAMRDKYNLQRIAIIDWDVHHGNATQKMFEADPHVLYISIHRYDNATFYPCSPNASPTMVGEAAGRGYNVNIAWNTQLDTPANVGDAEYYYAYTKLIRGMLTEYNPELIIVSAGFDSAAGDPLGAQNVTPQMYGYLTRELMGYANGQIAIALEGGYNCVTISDCMTNCLRALLGENIDLPHMKSEVSMIAIHAVIETSKAHQPHWNFLKN